MDGKKEFETRENKRLEGLTGKRIHIIRTGKKIKAKAIGAVTVGQPLEVGKEEFDRMRATHCVPRGSEFDLKDEGR